MLIWILLVGIVFIIPYVYRYRLKKLRYIVKKVNELPGKKSLPIIGNILEFLGTPDHVFRKVTSFFSEHSRYGIVRVWMSLLPYILIAEPDVIERVLRSPVNNNKSVIYSVVRPWLKDGLLTSTGQKWHVRRKLLTPGFHFNVLQKFLSIFNKESKSFVDTIREHVNYEIDVKPPVSIFTLDTICETAMGTKLEESHDEGDKYRKSVQDFGYIVVERSIKTWLLLEPIYRFTKTYLKQVELLNILHGYSKRVIDTRKKTISGFEKMNEDDKILSSFDRKQAMLDLLITAQKQGENIDDEGIQEEVDTFVFEGHDTTAVSLSFSLMLLANNKKCQEKVYEELRKVFGDDDRDPTNSDLQELRYLECCIKESLRLYPSVPKISRELGEDIYLDNGLVIPKDCVIVILIYEMHRRADLYPDPEKFIPDRFLPENTLNRHPYAYIPFSAGPRNCIGQKFAMMEMKSLLSAVLRNYILEPVDTPETIVCMLDLVLRTKNPIRVKFIPRTH